jgi:hypothetical protein
VIADPVLVAELPVELAAGDPLAGLDRLQHRAVGEAPAADVVDRRRLRVGGKGEEGVDEVGAVDVVAHLLAAVAEDGVVLAGHRALHQVGEEPVQLGAGVLGAGQTAAAEADRRQPEVAAVLLDQQVGGRLGDPEQRVGGGVDRHRGVDTAEVAVVFGQLEPGLELLQRQPVGGVAVDLVGRAEDEGRARAVRPGGLEQVQGAVGVDPEVGLRLPRRPVVRRLRGSVDDQPDAVAQLGEKPLHALGVADVEVHGAKLGKSRHQLVGHVRGRGLGAEEARPHVVLEPDHVPAGLDQVTDRLRADQPAGAGDDGGRHQLRAAATPSASGSAASLSAIQAWMSASVCSALREGRQSVCAYSRAQSET